MRVLVATDTIGALTSAQAGRVLAQGWSRAEVTVVPLGEAGAGFLQGAADQRGAQVTTGLLGERMLSMAVAGPEVILAVEATGRDAVDDITSTASSADLGRAVLHALGDRSAPLDGPRHRRLVVDLTGVEAHDGGAGFLAALGARGDAPLDRGVESLTGLTRVDLAAVRRRLAGLELVGVVPSGEVTAALLGLRGITSLKADTSGLDRSVLLDVDAALANFAHLVDAPLAAAPGAGACGGLGFAILALGGRLVTGPQLALGSSTTPDSLRSTDAPVTDLVVTGCSVFDFARRGGGVVAEAARVATAMLCPCIAVAGRVLIGGREMRTMGIESAYAVGESTLEDPNGKDVTESQLSAVARRVARSWQW